MWNNEEIKLSKKDIEELKINPLLKSIFEKSIKNLIDHETKDVYSDKIVTFENEKLVILADQNTSPYALNNAFDIHDLSDLVFDYAGTIDFTWDNAPCDAIAWCIDSEGNAFWSNCDDIVFNTRFKDWQVNRLSSKNSDEYWFLPAPTFSFDCSNAHLSLIKKNIVNDFKITVIVEKI